MSRSQLEKTASYMDKLAYGGAASGITGALANAAAKNPWAALTIGGVSFGAANALGQKALSASSQPVDTTSYEINRMLRPGLMGAMTRIQADEQIAKSLLGTFDDIGGRVLDSTLDEVSKKLRKSKLAPSQKQILEDLIASDEIISKADPEALQSVYSSMLEAAPTIAAKHKESVRSFLRQGLAHEGGIDPMTIGQLARAEAAVRGKNLSNLT